MCSSKIPSTTKSTSNKHKPGLAQMITNSSKEIKMKSDTASEALFQLEEVEEAVFIIQGFFNSAYIFNGFPEIC